MAAATDSSGMGAGAAAGDTAASLAEESVAGALKLSGVREGTVGADEDAAGSLLAVVRITSATGDTEGSATPLGARASRRAGKISDLGVASVTAGVTTRLGEISKTGGVAAITGTDVAAGAMTLSVAGAEVASVTTVGGLDLGRDADVPAPTTGDRPLAAGGGIGRAWDTADTATGLLWANAVSCRAPQARIKNAAKRNEPAIVAPRNGLDSVQVSRRDTTQSSGVFMQDSFGLKGILTGGPYGAVTTL